MIGMKVARSFRELSVYLLSREGAQRIFQFTKQFPSEERYSLTDQIRRSSRAVKAMIAEAWARRRYKAAFINKIDEALGESNETQSWLEDGLDCSYLSSAEYQELDSLYRSIGAMLARMIDRADDFCKHAPSTDYRSIGTRVEEEPSSFSDASLSEFFHHSPLTDH